MPPDCIIQSTGDTFCAKVVLEGWAVTAQPSGTTLFCAT